jgi:hypothetical protein
MGGLSARRRQRVDARRADARRNADEGLDRSKKHRLLARHKRIVRPDRTAAHPRPDARAGLTFA